MTNDLSLEKYRRMQRIREFETVAEAIHAVGEVPGALHTYTGQEATGVGACIALDLEDYMVGNHRSPGHPIAKGAALRPPDRYGHAARDTRRDRSRGEGGGRRRAAVRPRQRLSRQAIAFDHVFVDHLPIPDYLTI